MSKLILVFLLVICGCATTSTESLRPKTFLGIRHYGCGPEDQPMFEYEITISDHETLRFVSETDSNNKVSVTYCSNELEHCQEGEGEYLDVSQDFIKIDIKVEGKKFQGRVLLADGSGMECG